jgi:hypothetical protein
MPIDFTTDTGKVRLLLNDVDEAALVFSDGEIAAFLALEGGNVKRATAQAIDTNADNEALASKVLSDHQLKTDGAAVANALRARAKTLREQADRDDAFSDDGSFVEVVPTFGQGCVPEYAEYPGTSWCP